MTVDEPGTAHLREGRTDFGKLPIQGFFHGLAGHPGFQAEPDRQLPGDPIGITGVIERFHYRLAEGNERLLGAGDLERCIIALQVDRLG